MRQGKIFRFLYILFLWPIAFGFRQINIFGSNSRITPTVKHAKFRGIASIKIAFDRGKFLECKVWKGQVYGKSVLAEISAR
ncbi:hypothetical protein C1S93_24450 [Vibrio parahaemolyticus]|nr:hypothetical protein EM55_023880 [Vibrio parahaemolyticus]OOQ77179.1 hypothetical protein BSR65_22380 [Vibrio parahaemolyticus]PMT68833.1 hypothetical protein C1S93_24450 [Vibrio parahaemolyticus]TOB21724.1 hypothetical protein CGK11_22270 [Vibrio parahaemolyticus]